MTGHLLGEIAQPCRLVDRLPDHGVLEALLGPDVACHHLSGGDSDACLELRHLGTQPLCDRPRCSQRLVLGVGQRDRRTEHRQDRVALELVDQAAVVVDLIDDDREEPVEQVDHLDRGTRGDQLRRADDIDENDCGMALLATQDRLLLLGQCGDLAADVAAEQIAHPLALPQAVHHRVETALQLTQFGAVEHHQIGIQIALLDAIERRAHDPDGGLRSDRTGSTSAGNRTPRRRSRAR
ncbi:hypothetical protein ATO49_20475 [Mycolicibacterium fortuitum subsp. fortuitum DSM 46621 = ATCC 6841 = JCM 6387]|nr:hypothetical protein ATO49_20475 [Mycolicibacterium fortuitum subsp. fortuitum DSM 46621 = ATCC 6841 = JCM 6387]